MFGGDLRWYVLAGLIFVVTLIPALVFGVGCLLCDYAAGEAG